MAARPDNLVSRWLLILLLLVAVYFFHDFLVPVLGALIIGFASWPLYDRLHGMVGKRDALAASLAVLAVMVVLIVPLSMAFTFAFGEVKDWMEWLIEANRDGAPILGTRTALPLPADAALGEARRLGVLLDVRSKQQFAAGHVRGSINTPLIKAFTT